MTERSTSFLPILYPVAAPSVMERKALENFYDKRTVSRDVYRLLLAVSELQSRHLLMEETVVKLAGEVAGLRLAINYTPGERQAERDDASV